MAIRVTSDAKEFQATVFPFLERDPVLNTVILSNVAQRAEGSSQPQGVSTFVSVHDAAGQVVGAAMRTPGRGVYLGGLDPAWAEEVADAYAEQLPTLGGVAGSRPAAEAFARRWGERFGTSATEGTQTRLHKLVELVGLHAPGVPRLATAADIERAAAWVAVDFGGEILAQGNQACLYTDLANPTSNKIYHQAGYRPVADFVDLRFTTP